MNLYINTFRSLCCSITDTSKGVAAFLHPCRNARFYKLASLKLQIRAPISSTVPALLYKLLSVKESYVPFGWNILDTNLTVGGLFGYSSVNSMVSLNVPIIEKGEGGQFNDIIFTGGFKLSLPFLSVHNKSENSNRSLARKRIWNRTDRETRCWNWLWNCRTTLLHKEGNKLQLL